MKTTEYLLSLFIILCAVQWNFAQATVDRADRSVKRQTLISDKLPEIRIKFNKNFKFAGSQEFVLYDRAKAEQYFFVEAEDKKIKRMFMVQFEGYLPAITGKYEYNEPQTTKIGGLDYFSNAEIIPDVEAALKAVPNSDIARAARFLQEKGFIIMNSLLYQRFVRVLDESKRHEFIMLYIEAAEDLNSSPKQNPLKSLDDRALANFKVKK